MNPWFIAGAVIAVAVAGGAGYVKGSAHGKMVVQAEWDAERIRQQEAHTKALQESIAKQQALQADADQLRQEKDRETRDLATRNTTLLNSLRNRPERSASAASSVSGSASTGCACAACTGAGLSKQDAEFLAGEAARADELRIALDACVRQYETLRTPR